MGLCFIGVLFARQRVQEAPLNWLLYLLFTAAFAVATNILVINYQIDFVQVLGGGITLQVFDGVI